MPINYSVLNNGHFIQAETTGIIKPEEFIDFEVEHAIDKRLKSPVAELLVIKSNSFKKVSEDDIRHVMDMREKIINLPSPHRCAIVVPLDDVYAWDLAKFYEGMATLHYPESVIIFGDSIIARAWLGVNNNVH